MISNCQCRVFNFNGYKHATHSEGFFIPDSFDKLIKDLKDKNILTGFFTLHPNYKPTKEFEKYIIHGNKKIYYINLNSEINYLDFSKSFIQKIKKFNYLKLLHSSNEEFLKIYKSQKFYNKNQNLNLNYKNIKIYKIQLNNNASYAVIGLGESAIEFLLGCSSSVQGQELSSTLIYKIIKKYHKKAEFFNLGGGIKHGDGIERFKSFFKSKFAFQRIVKIIIDKKLYESLKKEDNNNFFPKFAKNETIAKFF